MTLDGVPSKASIDLLELSTLALPGLVSRRLGDICTELDIPLDDPHRALADATATGAAIRKLIDGVDVDDPSWQLAIACLVLGEHPLARLLPAVTHFPDLTTALQPAPDELCSPGEGRSWTSAVEAGVLGLRSLEDRPGYRKRNSQREMAEAVGRVQDNGGGLAVEAPTGTGKSLAYLLPSAGRAAEGKPVVVATATKVLQQQLRDDALRLRSDGLLPAPFRQIQGVSNYICTRAVAESLEDPPDDRSSWLALAVAVRGLNATPTGTWNDVTDGVLQRRDARYRLLRNTLRTDADGCERRQCPWVDQCPLFARLSGLDRDPGVLSVNHALVAAWIAQASSDNEEGDPDRPLRSPTDVLSKGGADLVFDEAHDLEDTLTSAWTETLSEYSLAGLISSLGSRRGPIRLAQQAARRLKIADGDLTALADLRAAQRDLRSASDKLGGAVDTYVHEYGGSGTEAVLQRGIADRRPEFHPIRSAAFDLRVAIRAVRRSALGLVDQLKQAVSEEGPTPRPIAAALSRLFAVLRQLESPLDLIESLRDLPDSHLWLHRLRVDRQDGEENGPWFYERLPIHIAGRFSRDVVGPAHSVVLTSATLARRRLVHISLPAARHHDRARQRS